MKIVYLITIVFFIFSGSAFAQYGFPYNKVWTFGYKSGLDFNSGSPLPVTSGYDTATITGGNASVCDATGQLLFYSNGYKVYNRNHVLMPNGASIVPFYTSNSTQAALIVPVIGSPDKYYLFSLQQRTAHDTAMCRLVYCIIDMSLNGGLGDVITTTKNTALADSLADKMIAITGNNKNIWLVTHALDTALFYSFEITSSGIASSPVVSASGTFSSNDGYLIGEMKASNNRRMIATTSIEQIDNKFGLEVYDFNPITGIVSNCVVLDSTNSYYGVEFSPNNKLLYASRSNRLDSAFIYQFNLDLSSSDLIRSSKIKIAEHFNSTIVSLRLGPDNKIYFISSDSFYSSYSRFLDCIYRPDSLGTACNYVPRAITLLPGTGMQTCFPNIYVTEDTTFSLFSSLSTSPIPSIFPNPVRNKLHIMSNHAIQSITIYDLLGRKYNPYTLIFLNNAEIDFRETPKGFYFVAIDEHNYKILVE